MVKFSRELEAQLIPEWKYAFVDYRLLKSHVKRIRKLSPSPSSGAGDDRHPLRRFAAALFTSSVPGTGDDEGRLWETDSTQSREEEMKGFHSVLVEEIRKVDEFFTIKEAEFCERGEALKGQLEFLLHLEGAAVSGRGAEEDDAAGMDMTKGKSAMRIDVPEAASTRAIAAFTSLLWEDMVNSSRSGGVSRKKIECAEKMIRGAFVELYKALGLLQFYSSLNMLAFRKILKKFDKVSNEEASLKYLSIIKETKFMSSRRGTTLADEVECIFTKNFASNDRKKAMKFLRPQQPKDSHLITFFVGLFTGSFVTLFTVYAIMAHTSGVFSTKTGYMETVYPVFSMFALLSLHIFLYGCNLFMWRSTRINHNFIFEFSPHTALKHRDAFLICTSFMTMVVGAMVIHLILRSAGVSTHSVDAIPSTLLLLFIGILVCPFNILYRSTRFCLLRVMRNIIFSPFYKVLMVDFFLADQLTSQIPLLRHMERTACYFLAGSFTNNLVETCTHNKRYKLLAYVISLLPYWWRTAQCGRRCYEEGYDVSHLVNAGKYISAMLVAATSWKYSEQKTPFWLSIVSISSIMATTYQLYWDFVKDWGLFQPRSKNLFLRDELILKTKGIYYASIGFNFILRLAWIVTLLRLHLGPVENRMVGFLLASLEIIRRGHWNYYRLENEHLNNVGRFRAVNVVPLPFHEIDSDG